MQNDIDLLKSKLKDHEDRIKKLENMANENLLELKNNSIKDFMFSKNPSTDVQKTLVIGYYFEEYENEPSFNVDDILKGFNDSKEIPPDRKKIYDKIKANVDKKYMMVAEGENSKKKSWKLTNDGLRYVENNFNKLME